MKDCRRSEGRRSEGRRSEGRRSASYLVGLEVIERLALRCPEPAEGSVEVSREHRGFMRFKDSKIQRFKDLTI